MLAIEPSAGIAPIVHFIRDARGTLDINTYLASDRQILRALHSAVRHGVRVRILIARHPYGRRPRGERKRLRATGAQIRYAPPRFTGRYIFDHAKYMVSGNESEIGSANLTWSAFHKNREYIWTHHSARVANALRSVFTADWTRKRAGMIPRQTLVLSPGAGAVLTELIRRPGSVCIESEELGHDRPVLAALRARGPAVRLLLPASLSRYDRRIAAHIAAQGVQVRYLNHPYLHAKLIVTPTRAFIGSENFSQSSLNRNREVGIVLRGGLVHTLQRQCTHDWEQGHKTDHHYRR